jgi:hypothetical protein
VRQCCNVAYATLAEGRDEGELEELDIALGMIKDPEEEAMAALREYQRSIGMAWDDTPVAAPLGSKNEEIRGERW